jgi:hypothetical protein
MVTDCCKRIEEGVKKGRQKFTSTFGVRIDLRGKNFFAAPRWLISKYALHAAPKQNSHAPWIKTLAPPLFGTVPQYNHTRARTQSRIRRKLLLQKIFRGAEFFAAAPLDSGWRRRLSSAAEGSTLRRPISNSNTGYRSSIVDDWTVRN